MSHHMFQFFWPTGCWKKLRILLHIFLCKYLTHHCSLTLAPCSSRSEKIRWTTCTWATVSYMLKSCNLKRTKIMLVLDWLTIFPHKFCKKKILLINSSGNLLLMSLYLPQTFDLLNTLFDLGKWTLLNYVQNKSCHFYMLIKNCTMHFNLRGWWWCLKECQWWYICSKMSKTFFLNQTWVQNVLRKKINQSKTSTMFCTP